MSTAVQQFRENATVAWKRSAPGPVATTKDPDLISLSLQGEEHAFRMLVNRYRARIYSFVLGIVKDPEDARDISQEVFIKIYRHLEKYDSRWKFSNWLYKIAQNMAIDFLKKRRYEMVSIDSPYETMDGEITFQIPSKGPLPDRELEHVEIAAMISHAITELRPELRSAIVLHYLEGKTYAEISEIFDIPIGTAKSLLFRARQLLREKLECRYPACCA